MVAIDTSAFGSGSRASAGTAAWPVDTVIDSGKIIGRHRAQMRASLTWRRAMYSARHRAG
ncbi:hypothetical protein SAMN05444157_2142 [Frankineae bacterium MT45]|nr:hypothetical protein SAMN05444157_2142 [Frankineae bacterium MT45]